MENTINLTTLIFNSINELFSKIFSSVDNTIYSVLDNLVFIDEKLLSENSIQTLLGESSSNGIVLICNSLVFGILIYYAINYLISHLTYSRVDSPKQFFFKAIIYIPIMNSSFWICEQIINLISIITNLISSLSISLFNTKISFGNFIDNLNKCIYISNTGFDIFSFDGIIKSFTSFGLINLVFTYSLRYIMIQIFVLISPFAFLSLLTNNSDWFFKIWIKSFVSLLLIQILISLILLLSFAININNSLFSKILYVGIIYALSKANSYMKDFFGGISTSINSNLTNFISK